MTDEIKKEVALFFYNANYPEVYSEKELQEYKIKVEQIVSIIDNAIQAERERLVNEIKKLSTNAADNGFSAESSSVGYDTAIQDILNLINPPPTFSTAPTFETLQEAVDSGQKFAVVGENPFQPSN